MIRFRTASILGSLVAASVTVAACNGEDLPGAGVMVVMRTDMTFPLTVSSVGLYIDRIADGKTTSLLAKVVPTSLQPDGTNTVSLPSNFAIQGTGKADSSLVRVRVVAFHGDTVLALRESRAGIPRDHLAELGMPMLWMNTDEVTQTTDADGNVQFASSACPADQTLGDDGSCEPVLVTDLPLYEERPETTAVEAGACDPGCFDVSECFKPESVEDPDEDFKAARGAIGWFDAEQTVCGVPLGARGELARNSPERVAQLAQKLAVAVRVDPGEGASCTKQDPSQCFIVLDAATKLNVATKRTDQGERLWATLPAGICRKWQAGRIVGDTAVAVPGCERKRADQPLCTGSQVGCTTDEGWDGKKNPRAGQSDRDAALDLCAVPGATAVWATGTEVLAMTQAGQVVSVPRGLGRCAPAPIGAPVGPGTFRFADAVNGTLAFMNVETGLAGTIVRDDAGGTVGIPAAVTTADQPWGVGFARGAANPPAVYLGRSGGFVVGGATLSLLPALGDFTRITNGVDDGALGTRFVVGNGSELTVLNARAQAVAAQGVLSIAALPLHAVALGTSLYVLTGAGTALTPGLARLGDTDSAALVLAPAAPFGSLPREMPLTSSARALFFGDLDGHVYRVEPAAGAGPTPAELVVDGTDPVHSVYYAESPVPGTDTQGFLYLIKWPGNDPARAQIERHGLRADGSVVPDPDAGTEPDASGSSSGEVSSGGSSSSSTGGPSVDDGGPKADAMTHADTDAEVEVQPL